MYEKGVGWVKAGTHRSYFQDWCNLLIIFWENSFWSNAWTTRTQVTKRANPKIKEAGISSIQEGLNGVVAFTVSVKVLRKAKNHAKKGIFDCFL